MTIILQGMRRSGTTIVYDALSQDPALTCWYEPLAAAIKPSVGGGSGMQDTDLFNHLRTARQAYANAKGIRFDVLNHGAPRDPSLEFDADLPQVVSEYLQLLLQRPGPVMAKFTRIYRKVAAVARIVPDATFVHIVRDPRSVASSYLFGKNGRLADRFPTVDSFFRRTSSASAWSIRPFSDLVIADQGGTPLDPTDLERVLLVWRFVFEQTHLDGERLFGTRYLLLRHEDFTHDPLFHLEMIYRLEGRPVPQTVKEWVVNGVQPAKEPFAAGDRRWLRINASLGLSDALSMAGYEIESMEKRMSVRDGRPWNH